MDGKGVLGDGWCDKELRKCNKRGWSLKEGIEARGWDRRSGVLLKHENALIKVSSL
jgi:hypothetical protein